MILALAVSVADWMERQVSINVAMTSRNASSVRVLPFLRMEYRQARLHRFISRPPHFLRVKPVGSLVYLLFDFCGENGELRSLWCPTCGNTLMVHDKGGVEVELRSSFDGVGDRAQKSRGAFARKPLGCVE